ncbi:MAG: hypothetical protein WA097_06265 [Candidatus Hydromicrobium sp.]
MVFFGLKRKRLRQGYGELYNVKVDDMDISSDDIKNYLEFKDEEPEVIAHKYIEDMTKSIEITIPGLHIWDVVVLRK